MSFCVNKKRQKPFQKSRRKVTKSFSNVNDIFVNF